jgi:hypothetical protein
MSTTRRFYITTAIPYGGQVAEEDGDDLAHRTPRGARGRAERHNPNRSGRCRRSAARTQCRRP